MATGPSVVPVRSGYAHLKQQDFTELGGELQDYILHSPAKPFQVPHWWPAEQPADVVLAYYAAVKRVGLLVLGRALPLRRCQGMGDTAALLCTRHMQIGCRLS